ncbi:MAG: sensor domain-containing protein [Actinomycetota bacterium]|nr:sensor domain-containing protein [Actinomycetota bacterium]
MTRPARWALLLAVTLTGCGAPAPPPTTGADLVESSAVDTLLLGAAEIDALMGAPMTAEEPVSVMNDNRTLLPNLDCLGVWQVAEAAVYGEAGPGSWRDIRRQMSREPDADDWDDAAVQAVVRYDTAAAARTFLARSATRWSECTNHRVNITVNDRPLPRWRSGELEQTDTRLSIPFTRTKGGRTHSCRHVLAVRSNVVVDVQACKLQDSPATQAADIATAIESRIDDAASTAGG